MSGEDDDNQVPGVEAVAFMISDGACDAGSLVERFFDVNQWRESKGRLIDRALKRAKAAGRVRFNKVSRHWEVVPGSKPVSHKVSP